MKMRLPFAVVLLALATLVAFVFLWESQYPKSRMCLKSAPGEILFLRHGDIWTIDEDGENLRQLTQDGTVGSFVLSPNGQRVAYLTYSPPARSPHGLLGPLGKRGHSTLNVIDLNACRSSVLSQERIDYPPAWSPDSQKLAYLAAEGRLIIINLATREQTPLLLLGRPPSPELYPGGKVVVWAPNRSVILYVDGATEGDASVQFNLHAVDALSGDKKQLTTLTTEGLNIVDFVWFPTRRQIGYIVASDIGDPAYHSKLHYQLWAMEYDTGNVSLAATSQHRPILAPNGRYYAFQKEHDGIFLKDLDAQEERRIFQGDVVSSLDAAWSHNSEKVVFSPHVFFPHGKGDLWIYNINENLVKHLSAVGDSKSPAWFPQ